MLPLSTNYMNPLYGKAIPSAPPVAHYENTKSPCVNIPFFKLATRYYTPSDQEILSFLFTWISPVYSPFQHNQFPSFYSLNLMPESALFKEIKALSTEQRNPASARFDRASIREILEVINTEDHLVPIAVRREIPYITQAVEHVVEAFKKGGRLIYAGAGTSGRLGVVDASECPPTYGTPPRDGTRADCWRPSRHVQIARRC